MDYEKILIDSISSRHYFSNKDLTLNKNYGYLLNNNQLNEYIKFKENYNSSNKTKLDLKTFNSKYIYFYNSKELSNYTADYFNYTNNTLLIKNNYNENILSRVASELDGTLKIEGVNTTRKKILDIISSKKINDNNEQIKPCMDSLFQYVRKHIDKNNIYLPFIVHYYIIYIHPYFDYNGRTARMCSLWISYLCGNEENLPTFISEAINDDKTNYYNAIEDTINSNNDLTYFLT